MTGGAGFIGSHLVARLLAAGDRVTVLDDLSSGQATNLPPKARLVQGCVLDTALLDRVLAGMDLVIQWAVKWLLGNG